MAHDNDEFGLHRERTIVAGRYVPSPKSVSASVDWNHLPASVRAEFLDNPALYRAFIKAQSANQFVMLTGPGSK